MKKYCFGIDIGGTSVKCGLFDSDGEAVDKWEIRTRTEDKGHHILPDVAAAILQKIEEKSLTADQLLGIGVGVPGPVNDLGEVAVAVNLGWGYVNLVKELGEMTGLAVKAGNDANVAALGEMWKGGGDGHQNIVMVTLGTGVGGGVIHNGQIITGAHGAAGEIGHIHVEDRMSTVCNCGNIGCLEQVASATGIANLANQKLKEDSRESVLRTRNISAKSVFDAVKEGDLVAMEVAEQFGEYLGKALSIVSGVVDPEVFVIGGGVSKAGPILLDYICRHYQKYAFSGAKQTEFALARLGNDAGIFGAAKLICP